jgi:hypothetical protein
MLHKTKNGKLIELKDLSPTHLCNIIRRNIKLSKEGLPVETIVKFDLDGEGGYYDIDLVFGEKALKLLNHQHYLNELRRRNEENRAKRGN